MAYMKVLSFFGFFLNAVILFFALAESEALRVSKEKK